DLSSRRSTSRASRRGGLPSRSRRCGRRRNAARRLAEPVAALRAAALAVGRGSEPPAFPPGTPREFEPVLSAFDRMVTDVPRSQAALEEARLRTARELANVATGVIAADDGLRVTTAKRLASDLGVVADEPLGPRH